MSPNPRFVKALEKTRAMDIPDKEAVRALKGLLDASDNNWFLIENDHYQTLMATIYEIREDKVIIILFSYSLLVYVAHINLCLYLF